MEAIAADQSTRDLLEELARRLNAATGKTRLELLFVDGRFQDGYRHTRISGPDVECSCRPGGWNPACVRHPPSEIPLGVEADR
jgi:hypothetical protein